ncbi:hypothetical protein LOD99_14593 [Oopsacas minuta]|uniref:Uncharacterized protein n=1 Tax=Oopsacas minuta TaxID=111878 RepID=A0AAV7KFI2_9METZ|nr:hypothetical protein LOD99_14593 [Oopsacas minuta]
MAYALDLLADGNLTGEKMSKAIDIKQAILWIALAWRHMKSQTVVNCFSMLFGTLSLVALKSIPILNIVSFRCLQKYLVMIFLTMSMLIQIDLEMIGSDTEDVSAIPVPSTSEVIK